MPRVSVVLSVDETIGLETDFLRRFGVTAQREIETAVRQALDAGTLSGNETLKVRARLEIEGLDGTVVEDTIRPS